jgi:hypothetical protein
VNAFDNVHTGGAIDGDMVKLAKDCETALWQALDAIQAWNQCQFPQGVRMVQGLGVYLGNQFAEIGPICIGVQGLFTDVVQQLKSGVIHPVGVIKIQWQAFDLAGEHRGHRHSRAHVIEQRPPRDRRRVTVARIIQPDECTVSVGGLVLQVEKGRVHGRKLLHFRRLVHCQCEDTG